MWGWARDHAPPDALFAAPPDFGAFRLVGRRALLVDWKSLPFDDAAMRGWHERLVASYGETDRGGFAARRELDEAWRRVDDATLGALAARYGVDHALLYRETRTALPVLHENASLKIVALETGAGGR